MGWTVEFHDKAKEEIVALPDSLQKAFSRVFDRIDKAGLLSLSPKFSKHIDGDIWELRATARIGTQKER